MALKTVGVVTGGWLLLVGDLSVVTVAVVEKLDYLKERNREGLRLIS